MARKTKTEIMSGVENVKSRIVGNNTIEYIRENGDRVVRLHLTDILTFKTDGSTIYNTDGWQTVTTKARLNEYGATGWYIVQDKSIWYLTRREYWADKSIEKYVFKDGVTICQDGSVSGQGEDPAVFKKLQKQIDKYVNGFVKQLTARKIPQPSSGDCWDCCLKDEKTGRSMGDLSNKGHALHEGNHILSHFREKYYVPSLLVNVVEEFGFSQMDRSVVGYWLGMHEQRIESFEGYTKNSVKKNMRRYLKRRLGMAA